jgi:hypothetical protein
MGNNAPEIPLNKADVDRIFSCNKIQWQQATTEMTAAPGWNFRTYDHQDGTQILVLDQSTGKRLSIQPLFFNDRSLPTMVIVGSYFPLNSVPPMTEKLKREIETVVQENIGPAYSLKFIHSVLEELEIYEFIINEL